MEADLLLNLNQIVGGLPRMSALPFEEESHQNFKLRHICSPKFVFGCYRLIGTTPSQYKAFWMKLINRHE